MTTLQNSVTLDGDRAMVCLEAAWQLDALADLIANTVEPAEDSQSHIAVEAMCARMRRLAATVMSAVGEPEMQTESLRRILDGVA